MFAPAVVMHSRACDVGFCVNNTTIYIVVKSLLWGYPPVKCIHTRASLSNLLAGHFLSWNVSLKHGQHAMQVGVQWRKVMSKLESEPEYEDLDRIDRLEVFEEYHRYACCVPGGVCWNHTLANVMGALTASGGNEEIPCWKHVVEVE